MKKQMVKSASIALALVMATASNVMAATPDHCNSNVIEENGYAASCMVKCYDADGNFLGGGRVNYPEGTSIEEVVTLCGIEASDQEDTLLPPKKIDPPPAMDEIAGTTPSGGTSEDQLGL